MRLPAFSCSPCSRGRQNMEEESVNDLCRLFQAAVLECDVPGGIADNADANLPSAAGPNCDHLSSLLREIGEVFERQDLLSSEIEGLWDTLAERRISMGEVVKLLTGAMDIGGSIGVKAADIYMSLLLVPEWPVYSLFSEMAFESLSRCLKNTCKVFTKTGLERGTALVGGGGGGGGGGDRARKCQRKGKRTRGREQVVDADEGGGEDGGGQAGGATSSSSALESASFESIVSVLLKLQRVVAVLHLSERQETLKLIVWLLLDMLHLLSDAKESTGEENVRGKKRAGLGAGFFTISIPDIVFSTMGSLLGEMHGDPSTTAIIILRAVTPTILLTHTNLTHGVEVRNRAMQFVTGTLLVNRLCRQFAVALPRYLCFKAPEKTEGRSLAVESVMTLLRSLTTNECCRFTEFLSRMSHSKPRHRLIATDVASAMLTGLPDPLHNASLSNSGQNLNGVAPDQVRGHEDGYNDCDGDEVAGVDACLVGDEQGHALGRDAPQRDDAQGAGSSSSRSEWWGITCFEILLHRGSDKVPAIRARSLANLAQAIELLSADVSTRRNVQWLLGLNRNSAHGPETNVRRPGSSLFSSYDTPVIGGDTPSPQPSSDMPGSTPLTPGAGHRDLWSLVQRRCLDDKAAVRKSTLLLMKKSTALLRGAPEEAILQILGTACGDPMISIRKAAVSALSEIMRKFPGDANVVREWLKSVLPLAYDNEQSLQDECLSLFEELVFDRILLMSTLNSPRGRFQSSNVGMATASRETVENVGRRLPVGILSLLKEMADETSIASCVKRICSGLGKKKRVSPGVALALQKLISEHQSPEGAWFLLAEVSAFVPKAVGWEFLRSNWKLFDTGDIRAADNQPHQQGQHQTKSPRGNKHMGSLATWAVNRVYLLQTIANVAVELPPDAAAELATELLDRLKAFNMHPAEVGAHIKSLALLCKQKAGTADEGDELVTHWVKELLEQGGQLLQTSLSPSFCNPHTADGGMSSAEEQGRSEGTDTSDNQNTSTQQVVTAIFTIGALALICPKAKVGKVVNLLQTLLTSPGGTLRNGWQERILVKEKSSPEINIQAQLALGKLCLADDYLAKRCIPLFAQDLRRADLACVRNNVMIIMTDFCVRYTALTDEYMHDLTSSLRDKCELVRRQAFIILSRLLQRDYLKWRGMLFHRFLLALVDDSEKITQLAAYVFGNVLKTKAPLLAYNSFVEAIFVLNDCVSQASSSPMLQIPQSERRLFSLRGDTQDVVNKRMTIYSKLLQQMVPEHLLSTFAKLCAEILAAAADGLLDLNDGPSQCVLQDALRILASKELRITASRAAHGNADIEEDETRAEAAAAIAAVKGRMVTQLMKKSLVQNAVPIFIELKRMLETRNSPLLGLLMECIRVMLKDYKNEIEEILVADKQLQREILYDMQKHEEAKARAKVAAAATALPIHRKNIQRGTPGSARNPSASVPVSRRTPGNVVDITFQNAIRTPGGNKENEYPAASRSTNSTLRPTGSMSNFVGKHTNNIFKTPSLPTSLQRSATGNSAGSVENQARPSPRSARQIHQTPRSRTYSAIPPSSMSRMQCRELDRTPSMSADPRTSHIRATPFSPGQARDSSRSQHYDESQQEETCLAGAVAEVAAVTTVANVLQQVAQQIVSPLTSMSIPRLRPDLPRSSGGVLPQRKTTPASGLPVLNDPLAEQESLADRTGLETVRRRQSFSEIDEPCGLSSQGSD